VLSEPAINRYHLVSAPSPGENHSHGGE
jgi:hypothetical protein